MTVSRKHPFVRALRRLPLAMLPLAATFAVGAADQQAGYAVDQGSFHPPVHRDSSPLVEKVRRATARFRDINTIINNPDWVQATPCVSGPNEGAMGVHFLKVSRLHDGTLKGDEPEFLIYEPQGNGSFRLVGVEFVTLASEWADHHPEGGPAVLDGHLTNFVDTPNRYGLPAFYELHVWAWEDNPNGNFADWNTQVSCDKQKAE